MLSNRSMPDEVLIPVLAYRDVVEAIDWLTHAFGFGERWRVGDHRAQLAVGPGAAIALIKGSAAQGDDHVMVRVDDVEEHHASSRSRGVDVVAPPADHPYGERQYSALDFSGRTWVFTQSVADVAPEDWGGTSSRPPKREVSTKERRAGSRSAEMNTSRDDATHTEYVPVTYDNCEHITGPFYHGTKTVFSEGELLVPGHLSNYHDGRTSNHIYFATTLEPAIWAAELANALAGSNQPGHVYIVEPTGPFEDDPNLTNKRFPGNVTQSYRTRHPLRIVQELPTWEGHSPEAVQKMLDGIARLREQGLDVIED